MNNFFETVYAPVKVSERLPEKNRRCFVFTIKPDGVTSERRSTYWGMESPHFKETLGWDDDSFFKGEQVTHWLEPLQNRYIFTKEELERQFADLIEAWSDQKVDSKGAAGYAKVLVEKIKSQQ